MSAWIDLTVTSTYGTFRQGGNDAPTINKVLAAAASTGAKIVLGAGPFNIASLILSPNSGVELCGAGREAATSKMAEH